MAAPQKISDNLKPVSNRGGGSKSASNVETISSQTLDIKPPVKVATTANITLSGTQTVDGVSLSVGDRILVKDQTSSSENGIYIVQSSSWVRSNDANSNSKVNSGMIVFVKEGSINLDQIFILVTDGDISLDTTNLEFRSLTKDIGTAKEPVRAATTSNITLSGTQTIDGTSLSVDDRVLVKNQTSGSENGVYTVSSGSWTRSTDFDSNSKVVSGVLVYVKEGSLNGDAAFILTSDNPIDLGSTSLVFEKLLNITTQIVAGSGINLNYDSGQDTLEFSVKLSNAAPSSSTDTGSTGEIRYDSSHIYVCTATNTWKRADFSVWGTDVEYLVVAGGGGGGRRLAGGGGAGGYRTGTINVLNSINYTVTVGAGGSGSTSDSLAGSDGSDSVFASITSTGGGGGGSAYDNNGRDGGSGGGSSVAGAAGSGNTPYTSPSQGNVGGAGRTNPWVGGGGGGSSASGSDGANGGNGGNGTANSISGSSVTYAGGGGGAGYNTTNGPAGSGGAGGGGDGSDTWTGSSASSKGGDGTANTGGGGGGGTQNLTSPYPGGNGGNGGSGIVIIKLLDSITVTVGAGLTYTSNTSGGYQILTFTAGTDNISFS